MMNDVSRAFFHARATKTMYVQLPDENQAQDGEKFCGKLNVSLYGTRHAIIGKPNIHKDLLTTVLYKVMQPRAFSTTSNGTSKFWYTGMVM